MEDLKKKIAKELAKKMGTTYTNGGDSIIEPDFRFKLKKEQTQEDVETHLDEVLGKHGFLFQEHATIGRIYESQSNVITLQMCYFAADCITLNIIVRD